MSQMMLHHKPKQTRTAKAQRRIERRREDRGWRAETSWLAAHWREVI